MVCYMHFYVCGLPGVVSLSFLVPALLAPVAPKQVAREHKAHQQGAREQRYLPVYRGGKCHSGGVDQCFWCKITKKEPNGLLDSYA